MAATIHHKISASYLTNAFLTAEKKPQTTTGGLWFYNLTNQTFVSNTTRSKDYENFTFASYDTMAPDNTKPPGSTFKLNVRFACLSSAYDEWVKHLMLVLPIMKGSQITNRNVEKPAPAARKSSQQTIVEKTMHSTGTIQKAVTFNETDEAFATRFINCLKNSEPLRKKLQMVLGLIDEEEHSEQEDEEQFTSFTPGTKQLSEQQEIQQLASSVQEMKIDESRFLNFLSEDDIIQMAILIRDGAQQEEIDDHFADCENKSSLVGLTKFLQENYERLMKERKLSIESHAEEEPSTQQTISRSIVTSDLPNAEKFAISQNGTTQNGTTRKRLEKK